MFKSINREINQIINRGFDRTLRLAVTGLSRSGKTAFITSLINQLLHINQEGNAHLPLFEAARNQSILAVKRVPQQDLSIPRFDYEANLNDLMNNPPQWCQSTRGVSETRLAIRFERQSGLLRHFKERGTLYLDIFDYPGEWLLDLPLLNLDFQQWSLEQAKITSGIRQQFAQDWLDKLKKLDLSAAVNEDCKIVYRLFARLQSRRNAIYSTWPICLAWGIRRRTCFAIFSVTAFVRRTMAKTEKRSEIQ